MLDEDEQRDQHSRDAERAECSNGCPAGRRRFDDRPHEDEERAGHGQRPRDIEPAGALAFELVGADEAQRREKQCECNRGHDGEGVAPAQLRQHASDHKTEREPGGGSRGVEAQRPVPPVALSERGREDRERRRRCERRGHALDQAGGDQQRPVGGDGAEHRRGDERDQAPHEHALAAEHVGAPASEEEEPAIAKDERRDDPLQLAFGEAQGRADRRQRDLDEREVERVEEDDTAEDGQEQLLRRRPAGGVITVRKADFQVLIS